MRILLLTPQLPYPPTKGTAMRNLALLRRAAALHDVALLSFVETPPDPEALRVLRTLTVRLDAVSAPRRTLARRLLELTVSRSPDLGRRLASTGYAQRLGQLVEEFDPDIVQVEGLELARYLPVIRQRTRARILFDEHNCEYRLQQSAFTAERLSPGHGAGATYSRIQYQRLIEYERRACNAADLVSAVSAEDREALLDLGCQTPIMVLPNGVDCDAYAGWERHPDPEHPTLVFTGTMDFRPNIDAVTWFVHQTLPLLGGNLRFVIVGRDPSRAVRGLTRSRVDVTGAVPEIRPYLETATALVVPLRMGSGTRLKVLEAMAAGVPVISTHVGIAGIDAVPAEHVLLADTPEQFAQVIAQLLAAPEAAAAMAERARAFVRERYDWSRILPRLDDAWDQLRRSHRSD